MGHSIARTPNGRFYVWSDGAEQGWRCSGYFKTLDELVEGRDDLRWGNERSAEQVRNFVKHEYSRGYLPLRGPALALDEIPEWLWDIVPGNPGSKIPIMEGDIVYFREPEEHTRIKGRAVKRDTKRDWMFEVRTDDLRWLTKSFFVSEFEMWLVAST